MDGSHTAREVLVAVSRDLKPSFDDHVAELLLGGEALDAFDQVLVAVAVASDELADQGDCPKRPPLVDGVEERVPVGLAELEAGKDAAGPEGAVRLAQRRRYVGEVADAKRHRIQVQRARCWYVVPRRGGGVGGQEVGRVGLEEGQRRELGRREGGFCAGAADGQHGGVDVGDGDAHVGVRVEHVCVVQHAEGDVARAACYVEDVLRGGLKGVGGETRVEGPDEVVPVLLFLLVSKAYERDLVGIESSTADVMDVCSSKSPVHTSRPGANQRT